MHGRREVISNQKETTPSSCIVRVQTQASQEPSLQQTECPLTNQLKPSSNLKWLMKWLWWVSQIWIFPSFCNTHVFVFYLFNLDCPWAGSSKIILWTHREHSVKQFPLWAFWRKLTMLSKDNNQSKMCLIHWYIGTSHAPLQHLIVWSCGYFRLLMENVPWNRPQVGGACRVISSPISADLWEVPWRGHRSLQWN